MKPRPATEADCIFWSYGGTPAHLQPMMGRHLGAEDLPSVVRQGDKIRVPWVLDERDNIMGLREGMTVWTTFYGGMPPTDAVIV